jgi:hypothetical protein
MSVATDYKPWFDEKCSQFSNQTKHVKWQWLQDLNQSNADNLSNVGCEANGHCRGGVGGVLDGSGWSIPCPGHFTPGERNWHPFYRRLGGPQGQSVQVQLIFPPL